MIDLNFSVIRWHFTQWLKQLSLPLAAAFVLIVVSALVYLLHILPMLDQEKENFDQTEAQIAIQSNPGMNHQASQLPVNTSMQNKVTIFYDRFPTADTLPDLLEKINLEAESHQLTLDKGDYKLKLLRTKKQTFANRLVPYEITLPIQGDYRHIRTFINQLLATLPMLAITDVQMQRERIENKMIEARLRLVLFFSGQPKES